MIIAIYASKMLSLCASVYVYVYVPRRAGPVVLVFRVLFAHFGRVSSKTLLYFSLPISLSILHLFNSVAFDSLCGYIH